MVVKLKYLKIGIFSAFLSQSAIATPWAFTINYLPFSHVSHNVQVCYLEKISSQNDALNFQPFTSPTQLQAWAKYHKKALNQFEQLNRCRFEAALFGITSVPAVVQAPFVVYGEQNVGLALSEIKIYQKHNALPKNKFLGNAP